MDTKTILPGTILAILAGCGTYPGIDCPTDGDGYFEHKNCGEVSQRAVSGISPSVTPEPMETF